MAISVCYLDETGCLGALPTNTSDIQPVFVLTALFVDETKIRDLSKQFVALKVKYYPARFAHLQHDLEAMRVELKGAELKKSLRGKNGAAAQQTAQRFLDDLLELVKASGCRLVSRVWIKGIGAPFKGASIYSKTTQKFAAYFELYLREKEHKGIIAADFRDPGRNSVISHAIFSQKFKRGMKGDAYPSIIEAPFYGISNNHAGLQIADLISSALICPMATFVYCTGHVNNVHVDAKDKDILARYKNRVRSLEFRKFTKKKKHYGISVLDLHAGKTATDMWK